MKGLSIEHEKLAVAQSQQPAGKVKLNNLAGGGGGGGANAAAGEADSSPGAAFGGALPPYLHALPAYHRPYAPPLPPPIHHHHQHVNQFVEGPRRRALRSPQEPAAPELRSSVLRDGKAPLSPTPSPHARNYRYTSKTPLMVERGFLSDRQNSRMKILQKNHPIIHCLSYPYSSPVGTVR